MLTSRNKRVLTNRPRIADDFYRHLCENPLLCNAFVAQVLRPKYHRMGLTKLLHHSGPGDIDPAQNYRLVIPYSGPAPTTKMAPEDQVWRFHIEKRLNLDVVLAIAVIWVVLSVIVCLLIGAFFCVWWAAGSGSLPVSVYALYCFLVWLGISVLLVVLVFWAAASERR